MAGMNESAQQDVSKFTNMVEHISVELNCAVLALHHTGHGHEDRASGSRVFERDTDMMLRLEKYDKSMNVKATMTKQKDAPEWTKPKMMKLQKIVLSVDPLIDTLVVVSGKDIEIAKDDKDAKLDVAHASEIVDIEKAIIAQLESGKDKFYSKTKLATAVMKIVGGGLTNITKQFNVIIASKDSPAYKFFDGSQTSGRCWNWFYQDTKPIEIE